MTTPEEDEVRKEMAGWAFKLTGFVMSITIMITSWFLNQAWDRINKIESAIQVLEIRDAKHDSSTVASVDWIRSKDVIDNKSNELDRRITRLEESLPVIKDSLLDIKNTLKSK